MQRAPTTSFNALECFVSANPYEQLSINSLLSCADTTMANIVHGTMPSCFPKSTYYPPSLPECFPNGQQTIDLPASAIKPVVGHNQHILRSSAGSAWTASANPSASSHDVSLQNIKRTRAKLACDQCNKKHIKCETDSSISSERREPCIPCCGRGLECSWPKKDEGKTQSLASPCVDVPYSTKTAFVLWKIPAYRTNPHAISLKTVAATKRCEKCGNGRFDPGFETSCDDCVDLFGECGLAENEEK